MGIVSTDSDGRDVENRVERAGSRALGQRGRSRAITGMLYL